MIRATLLILFLNVSIGILMGILLLIIPLDLRIGLDNAWTFIMHHAIITIFKHLYGKSQVRIRISQNMNIYQREE